MSLSSVWLGRAPRTGFVLIPLIYKGHEVSFIATDMAPEASESILGQTIICSSRSIS